MAKGSSSATGQRTCQDVPGAGHQLLDDNRRQHANNERSHVSGGLHEDERLNAIECESAAAALATLLIGGPEVAMIFADVRGVMDGIDLARAR